MNSELAVSDLERALLDRAKRLAEEYLDKAHDARERIIQDENERLQLREERETLAAEADGERLYRRRVQASELRLQAELDKLRWQLVVEVKETVRGRLAALAEADGPQYDQVIGTLLRQSAKAIPNGVLRVEMNARDLERYAPQWLALCAEWLPGREAELAESPLHIDGGILVRDAANRELVDNSFRGRMERLEEALNQVIIERLLVRANGMGSGWHG